MGSWEYSTLGTLGKLGKLGRFGEIYQIGRFIANPPTPREIKTEDEFPDIRFRYLAILFFEIVRRK